MKEFAGRAGRLPGSCIASGIAVLLSIAGLAGCGGNNNASIVGTGSNNNPVTTQTASQSTLTCDDSMKTAFVPDANTTVLMAKSFKKGDPLLLSGTATASTPIADNDVCVVKLNVGPGNPGPADAPSTSKGIGIEIWLPTPANWNNRIHVKGGGGWAGGTQSSLTALAGTTGGSAGSPASAALIEGAVSASTDTGHANTANGGSFAMNPDGTINTTLWKDFSERGIHEMAVKTKALTKAYYGRDAKFAYWNGFSTGGRQGHKEAQVNPADFDGILAGAPVVNWTKFITAELYPQIVYQQDLGGTPLTAGQNTLVAKAAINACDLAGSQHLGYILDPSQCTYDPTKDNNVLCTADGGANDTADCLSPAQALAVNKIWYGQTTDGSVPDPAVDNGWAPTPTGNQKWYGLPRSTSFSGLGGAAPFSIATDMVALELQDPTLATPTFINAKGNGTDRWKTLSYADLATAWDQGVELQSQFANINTDNPDLSQFHDRGGKLLAYHGLADVLVPPQGTVNYYNRVAAQMGGIPAIQNFYRLYLIPGMSHGFSQGTGDPNANPPLATNAQLYDLLTKWVEQGQAPGTVNVTTAVTAANPVQKSRPICVYPLKPAFVSGDPNLAASFTCS